MSKIAFTTLDHGDLVFAGSESPTVLLLDSVFETIAIKRIDLRHGFLPSFLNGVLQRYKVQRELQEANPDCAVYWCALDNGTGYMCVSNLALPEPARADIQRFVRQSKGLNSLCSQLMSIGSNLPIAYKAVLMVLNSPVGVRHVFFIDRKPVFVRLIAPASAVTEYIEPLRATEQHLRNTGMLSIAPPVLCHGLCDTAQASIAKQWPDATVASLISVQGGDFINDGGSTQPMSSLAVRAYQAKRMQRVLTGGLPCYYLDRLVRYRYRGASIQGTAMAGLLGIVLCGGVLAYKFNDWFEILRLRTALERTEGDTQALHAKATEYSSAPKTTAQRLRRLDLLRSLQPVGPDGLLSAVSSVFEGNPDIVLNHISWFTVVADEDIQNQTQIADRADLSIDAVSADYLSVLITGYVQASSLSEQQALFGEFKSSLLSLEGVGDLIEERTPITQWRMPVDAINLTEEPAADSFALRFSLNHGAS